MKKLLTLFLTLVMAVCLVSLNNSHTKADDNDVNTPFTITATEDGTTVKFIFHQGAYEGAPPLVYQINNGPEYAYDFDATSFGDNDGESLILNKGDKVTFKSENGEGGVTFNNENSYMRIAADKNITASGNVMSLIDRSGFATNKVISYDYVFKALFENCSNLTSIDGLKLPATTLRPYCYQGMFKGCTGLTSVPLDLLPATTLYDSCYMSMFYDCSSLTNIPDLPATTLADSCYKNMFYGCVNLYTGVSDTKTGDLTEKFTIPKSGVTPTVGTDSTQSMFDNCGPGLTTPSSLPATYYRKPTPKPKPDPSPSQPKDESCEKVIGPTWHWNNTKGVCEEYATVGTATR